MKVKLIILSIFLCGSASAQIFTPVTPTTYGKRENRVKVDSALLVPNKELTVNSKDSSAQIFYRISDSSFYGYSNQRGYWKIGSAAQLSGDADSLSGVPGNQYMKYIDTAIMLSNYKSLIEANAAAIALKLNITDTAGEWVGWMQMNAGNDSLIFWIGSSRNAILMSNGGGSVAGSNNEIQYNNSGAFGADSTFKYNKNGLVSGKSPVNPLVNSSSGLSIRPIISAIQNEETLVGIDITPIFYKGSYVDVSTAKIKMGTGFIDYDSVGNFLVGGSFLTRPALGNSNFLGVNAGVNAVGAHNSNFLGVNAGVNTNAYRSNFLGLGAGSNATNAYLSNFFGWDCGSGATNASYSFFAGQGAGSLATNANNSVFIGIEAGYSASTSSASNFLGPGAGAYSSGASSNFLGPNAGYATVATQSNLFGSHSGSYSTNTSYVNFFGWESGKSVANISNSTFIGNSAGKGSNGASYSYFAGFQTGHNSTHVITGSNNILIGTNITTPTAGSTNMASFGNVLYLANTYGTTTGNPSAAAQTTGQVGINVTTPAASAALDITSTTAGLLIPRVSTAERDAIATPALGLIVWCTTDSTLQEYRGSFGGWASIRGAGGGSGWGLAGNAATAGGDFLGTTNNTSLRFRTNNTEYMVLDSVGDLTIKTVKIKIGANWGITMGQYGGSGSYSNIFGYAAGDGSTVSSSNFFGLFAGKNSIAANSNYFGSSAGEGANSGGANFFGETAGYYSVAQYSNFFGKQAGYGSYAQYSNGFGYSAAENSGAAHYGNFFGIEAGMNIGSSLSCNYFGLASGKGATNASRSNFFGERSGYGATGASYSNFFGYYTGHNSTHVITGSNNILIGTNITTPTAGSTNMASFGNVLYLANTYGTAAGNPSAAAQTTGQVGINVTTPAASAALDITSTTAGFLPPRMTATERDAIAAPALGLVVWCTTDSTLQEYRGTFGGWATIRSTGAGWNSGGDNSMSGNFFTMSATYARIDFTGIGNIGRASAVFHGGGIPGLGIAATKVGFGSGGYVNASVSISGLATADNPGYGIDISKSESAVLEAQSTTRGFLPPRMTATQAESIASPAEGLMIYSTDGTGAVITSKGWWGYDGSAWVKLN